MSFNTFYLNSQNVSGIIDGSNVVIGGNVGISTLNPQYDLDVSGVINSKSLITQRATINELDVSGDTININALQTKLETTKITTYDVRIASKTVDAANSGGSSSGYFINNIETPFIHFTPGKTYRFDQGDTTNSGHPLRFYLDENKTSQYSSGVTTSGTAGDGGNSTFVSIAVTNNTPAILYYQCQNHSYMGSKAYVKATNNTSISSVGTITSGIWNASTVSKTYIDLENISVGDLSDVSFNVTSTTDGQSLVWNSTDKLWEAGVVAGSGTSETEIRSLLGSRIYGVAEQDDSGKATAINSNGDIIAIGAPSNKRNGAYKGLVRVYQYTNSTWSQLGQDISGESSGTFDSRIGSSLSINGDGTILAVGSEASRVVRVFQYSNNTWSPIGQDITGNDPYYSQSISLNNNGTILAIGSSYGDGNGEDSGHVEVYQYSSNTTWSQIGGNLQGSVAGEFFGYSVSLNNDGSILSIGGLAYNTGNGVVRIYQYSNSTWSQLGTDLTGSHLDERFGGAVALNNDGTILAASAPYNDTDGSQKGHVRIYQYSNNAWSQLGNNIVGEANGDELGYSLDINGDGTVVIAGSPYNDGNGSQAGVARIYKYSNGSWIQSGLDIDGENAGDQCGWKVSINNNGDTFVVSSPYYNNSQGYTRVFQQKTYTVFNNLSIANDISFNGSLYQNGELFTSGNPIDETTDVSLNNLKVHGDLSANDASFNYIETTTVMINGTSVETELAGKQSTINQTTDVSLNNLKVHGDLSANDASFNNIKVLGDISFNGSLYQNGELFSSGNPIDETTDVSLNNLKVHGDLSANDASFNNIKVLGDISFNGNLYQNGSIFETVTSANDLSDISFNPASTTNGQALVWNSTDNVWEAGVVATSGGGGDGTKKTQLIEAIAGVCDGRTISGESATYTLSNVTTHQDITTTEADINGSSIAYTPPESVSQVLYNFKFSIVDISNEVNIFNQSHALTIKLYIDGVEVSNQRAQTSNYIYNNGTIFNYSAVIDVGSVSSDNVSDGKLESWDVIKNNKIDGRYFSQ